MDEKKSCLNTSILLEDLQPHGEQLPAATDDPFKTPDASNTGSPNGANASDSIEIVFTLSSNNGDEHLQQSVLSSASTNNTDICILETHYDHDDGSNLTEDEFLDPDLECDDGFLKYADILGKPEEFTVLQKPTKSVHPCNCEESTEVLLLFDTERHIDNKAALSGTDSDVEVLMTEEINESDWSSENHKIDAKHLQLSCKKRNMNKQKIYSSSSPISPTSTEVILTQRQMTAEIDVSTDDDDNCSREKVVETPADYLQCLNRSKLIQIIKQQEIRIQHLEVTIARYHKVQEKLFQHLDELRTELNNIRISPLQCSAIAEIVETRSRDRNSK